MKLRASLRHPKHLKHAADVQKQKKPEKHDSSSSGGDYLITPGESGKKRLPTVSVELVALFYKAKSLQLKQGGEISFIKEGREGGRKEGRKEGKEEGRNCLLNVVMCE